MRFDLATILRAPANSLVVQKRLTELLVVEVALIVKSKDL